MPYDPHKHHRRSVRLKGYDYSQAGAYFVTICTHKQQPLFGTVVDGQMRLSLLGQLVYTEWQQTAVVRPNVVMPNHLHGIIVIFLNDDEGAIREGVVVGATRRVAPTVRFCWQLKPHSPACPGGRPRQHGGQWCGPGQNRDQAGELFGD